MRRVDAESTAGADAGTRDTHSGTAPQTGRLFGFRHFTALQALAAVLLRVPLLLMAALGLAIIDPEELLLVGDIFGFLRATIIAYCVYMVVPFVNLGWVLLLRSIQAASVRAPEYRARALPKILESSPATVVVRTADRLCAQTAGKRTAQPGAVQLGAQAFGRRCSPQSLYRAEHRVVWPHYH